MNPSVDSRAVTSVEPAAALGRLRLWPVLAGIILFPVLQYGLAPRSSGLLPASLALAGAYLLGVYLYKSVAALARSDRVAAVATTAIGAIIVGAMVSPAGQLHVAVANTAIIPLAAILVGLKARTDSRLRRLYLIGSGIVAVAGLIMFAPLWSDLMSVARLVGQENVDTLKQSLRTLGYHTDAAESYGDQFQQMLDAIIRVIPAATIMNLVTQFSVGFLWFAARDLPAGKPPPFARWKMPFGLAPALIVMILGRLFGGETIALACDNGLLVLSIYYCVGGLALVEHLIGRLRLPLGIKILFYIMFTLTGLVGYLLTVLLGFIDSFADWRRLSGPAIGLEKR